MATSPIYITTHHPKQAILREIAAKVPMPLAENHQKVAARLEHALVADTVIGIAAPQLGYSLQMIIFNITEAILSFRKEKAELCPPTILINPHYAPVDPSLQNKDWESCLSVPDTMAEVYRYNTIEYHALTLDNRPIKKIAKGFLARVLQHEIDHLHGILFTDKITQDCRHGPIEEMRSIRLKELQEKRSSSLGQ